ncbi:MAG: Mur ligase family protein, partial [Oscillospiraceae bacterium]
MNMTKENFYEIIKTKRIAFIGVGVSHNDLIRKYAKMGADITVLDKSTKEKIGELYNEFSALGVKFILGENYLKTLNDFYMVFRSPGVKYMLEEILKAKDEGVIITSEMEMFFQLCPCKTYAVTGSDGKTTTTTLISKILQKEFENTNKKVYLGGNIGKALLPILDQVTQEDIAVVELSSFQLISMTQSPDVAVVTNIEPNHLDAHKDMKEYVQAKKNIFYHQSPCSKLIINKDNQITKDFFGQQRGMGLYFSRISPNNCGTSLDDNGNLVYQKDNKTTILFNKEDIQIKGEHNIENYLAACCAVFEDVSSQSMKFVAKNFGGVEHRNEFI